MMYLAAEICYNIYNRKELSYDNGFFYSYGLDFDLWKLMLSAFDCLAYFKENDWDLSSMDDYDLCQMFVEAAECGSLHAQWWCAYCMEHGINGFIEDPEDSRKMIENINTPIETLDFKELYFLKEEFSELNIKQTCAETSGFSEDYNPGSNALSRRTGVFASFVASLGLSHLFEIEYKETYFCWDRSLRDAVYDEEVFRQRTKWENWCKEHGMTTVGSDNQ